MSHPGDEGASAEGVVDDADEELPRPITAGEEEELALLHAVLHEEPRPPVAVVALPFVVVVDLDVEHRLAGVALLQDGACYLLALNSLHELGGQAETVTAPGQNRDNESGVPID
jgi:hypothetical protein